jgi:hypothetical protein
MFSRSFASSIKSPQDIAEDIAQRAYPTNKSVRRSSATSGEHLYTYEHTGFRVFAESHGNHAENLAEDYKHFIAGGNNEVLPYHRAIAALHHTHAARSMEHFRNQLRIIQQLTATPILPPKTKSTPQPAPQPDYTLSRHLLDKMKYALPQHPKTLVVMRTNYCDANFDPANVPPERTFIKKCCEEPSSADTCCCHVGTSNESVQYTNAFGECVTVHYFRRKNDFFNINYRMWYNPSDDERVPHSPSEEVSETEIFPACYDHEFQGEMVEAEIAAAEGFTHVWKNKSNKRRFERRQRRRQQVESGELPKYGLIIVIVDTEETRARRPHPIAGYDDERRQLYKARYEKIRDTIHTQAVEQGLLAVAAPKPEQPKPEQPQPKRRHVPDILHPFLLRRKLQHLQHQHSIAHIQRPLSYTALTTAHSVARTQVTAISALQQHHRLRTVAGPLIALLTIRLCCERTSIPAIVNQHLNNYRDPHYVHNLHHDGLHHVLRRASGSHARVNQIVAPYVDYATNPMHNITEQLQVTLKQLMAIKFKGPIAPHPEFIYGPHSFHKAEYYADECLKLIDATATDPASAARWADLRAKVQSVRRGERTSYDVVADPGTDNEHWIYSIRHTFYLAIKHYMDANTDWLNTNDRTNRHAEGTVTIRVENGASLFWPRSKETQIRINASRVVQTTLMLRAMYRFIVRASCVISPEFMGVFGFDMRFVKTIIARANYLATKDGDEASALVFGHFLPCLMTPDIHLDIFAGGNIFQHPELYVKMSSPIMGELKKEFRDVIPSRHTGTIDRSTLERPVQIRRLT